MCWAKFSFNKLLVYSLTTWIIRRHMYRTCEKKIAIALQKDYKRAVYSACKNATKTCQLKIDVRYIGHNVVKVMHR